MVELASALVAPVAKLLLKSWLGDTGADVGDNLLRLAFNRLGDWAKAQVALQRTESIAKEIVKELETFFAREHVNRQQLQVAAYEVGETIRACVGARFLVQQKLNVQEIERGLLEARPLDTIYTPSEPERGAYIELVRALAPRLRAVAPEVPGFELERDATLLETMAKVAADTPRILSQLEIVHETVSEIGATVQGIALREDHRRADYESKYLKAVLNTLDYVEILGLDVDRARREASLSIAYLSLTTNIKHVGKIDYEMLFHLLPLVGNRLLIEGAAGSGKSTLLRWTAVKAATNDDSPSFLTQWLTFRNESAQFVRPSTIAFPISTSVLSDFRKHDWFRSASEELVSAWLYKSPDRLRSEWPWQLSSYRLLTHKTGHDSSSGLGLESSFRFHLIDAKKLVPPVLSRRIPFLIRLRHVEGGLPSPKNLPQHLSSAIGEPPENWVRDLLSNGDALLLIDGIDEVPEGACRDAVLYSIEEYVKLYDRCPVIIATRPKAFDKTRLRGLGFAEAEVDELTPEQQGRFIDSWHRALAANLGRSEADAELMGYAEKLKGALQRQPQVALLATNPLLCAGICALHERGPETLPKDEWDLCEKLTQMLVDLRDRSHGRQESVRVQDFGSAYLMPYPDKRSILARIAEAMVSQQLSALPREEALDHVSKALPQLRSTEGLTPEAVLGALEARSGVLRAGSSTGVQGHARKQRGAQDIEAPRDAVEFVHNTLKAWLAALHSLDANKPRELAARALVSGYDEVIPFAAAAPGHLKYAETLIESLLRSAERSDPSPRRSLLILAMRCDTAATSLPEQLRLRLKALQHELFPPKSFDEAQQLATLGDAAIPNLAPCPDMAEAEAAACVRCLRLIGTEQASRALNGYRETRSVQVLEELAQAVDPLTLPAVLEAVEGDFSDLSASIKNRIHDLQPLAQREDLESIHLGGTQVGDDGMRHLAQLASLKFLDLGSTRLGDAGMAHVAKLASLETLLVGVTQVSDAGVEHIAKLTNLRLLDLTTTRVGDHGMEHIAKLRSLVSLYIGSTRVGDAGVEHLTKLANLEFLDLSSTEIGDAGVEHLAKRASLHSLGLRGTEVSGAGMEHLAQLANLEYLELSGTDVDDDGVRHLAKLANLKSLQLGGTQVSDAGLEPLARLTKLQSLDLSGTDVGDAGVLHLAKRASLNSLGLRGTQVSDAGLKHLAKLANLEDLELSGTQVGDDGTRHLAKLANLKSLHLADTRVSDTGLEHLAKLANLQSLDLSDTQVGDAGIEHLVKLTNLKYLNLIGTGVGEEGRERLRAGVPRAVIVFM